MSSAAVSSVQSIVFVHCAGASASDSINKHYKSACATASCNLHWCLSLEPLLQITIVTAATAALRRLVPAVKVPVVSNSSFPDRALVSKLFSFILVPVDMVTRAFAIDTTGNLLIDCNH